MAKHIGIKASAFGELIAELIVLRPAYADWSNYFYAVPCRSIPATYATFVDSRGDIKRLSNDS
jgi:hypothetical protein